MKKFKNCSEVWRDRFGGFRALKWAWQKVVWQINRNLRD